MEDDIVDGNVTFARVGSNHGLNDDHVWVNSENEIKCCITFCKFNIVYDVTCNVTRFGEIVLLGQFFKVFGEILKKLFNNFGKFYAIRPH